MPLRFKNGVSDMFHSKIVMGYNHEQSSWYGFPNENDSIIHSVLLITIQVLFTCAHYSIKNIVIIYQLFLIFSKSFLIK